MANTVLRPLGARIIKNTADHVEMMSAIGRVIGHGFEPACVIDIGASDGKWSRDVMRVLPGARYLAIEPLQERRGSLEKLKSAHENFDYSLCVAGSANNGMVTLHVSGDLDGSTVDGGGGPLRDVPVRTIDGLVAEKGLRGPFLLKFDTHGYELPILDGARDTLRNTLVVIMEVYNFRVSEHGLRFHEMCQRMETLGFRCYDMADPMLRAHDQALWQMDLFFCRQDNRMFAHDGYQ
jgi:FkbM family methyltransferase